MTETTATRNETPYPGLAARLTGVVFSPRDAYTAVVARPTWFGAMAVAVVLMAAIQSGFFSTSVGKEAYVDQALSTLKAFGMTVNDQMVQSIEAQANAAAIRQGISLVVFMPLISAVIAGLLLAIFTAIMGGSATYKQVYAVVAHSMIIGVIQQAFSFPIMYARGEMTSPTKLAVFFPMLDETSFFTYLFSAIDLFYLWSLINVSIGVAVLYKRSTAPVAAVLLGIYAVIAVIIAAVRAF
jgi:hypothetical protein